MLRSISLISPDSLLINIEEGTTIESIPHLLTLDTE